MTPRRRSPAQLAGQRQVQPSSMVAFAAGITAATLADRPHDCVVCTWVPVAYGVPGSYAYGELSALKFADRNCRSHGRYAGGGA